MNIIKVAEKKSFLFLAICIALLISAYSGSDKLMLL